MTTRFRASVPLTDDWQHFDFAVADGVATVTLNRPEKLNPLTFESYADLRDLVLQLPYRDDVRVLVLRGQGKAFCAGGDVNEIIGELIRMRPRELMALHEDDRRPHPGHARGAGADHLRHPGDRGRRRLGRRAGVGLPRRAASARFAFLFTKVGLSGGDMGAAYLLPRVVGAGRATQLLMLGDTIDAATADRYGLVSELVDDDELDDAVDALARRLADRPDPGLRADQGADHPRARHVPGRRDGARRDDPGAADDHRRPRGVPRRLQRAPPAALVGHVTAARTCLVTGAGRGIGAAVAARLSADGHRVAPARRATPARSTASGRTCPGPR